MQYAFMLLGYRSRSEKELEERLQKKGFSGSNIASAIDCLKKNGYLDDCALALDLKRQASDNKLLGHHRTKKFLLDRGLPNEIVNAALIYDEETEAVKIKKLIEKKLHNMEKHPDKKDKKKLYDFLVRKGYGFSTINSALHDFTEFKEEE